MPLRLRAILPYTAALAMTAFLAGDARGTSARIEFLAQCDRTRLLGSRICFFAGQELADPIANYLGTDDVRCFPADLVLEVPKGRWHFYAEHDSGFVSRVSTVIIEDDVAARDAFKRVQVPMRPAARVDFDPGWRENGATVGVWFFETTSSTPYGVPLTAETNSILVPASLPFVPLAVTHRRIEAFGPTLALPERTTKVVQVPTRRSTAASDIVAVIHRERMFRNDRPRPAPAVSLTTGEGRRIDPETPLHRLSGATLVVFREVPLGKVLIAVGGTGWQPDSARLDTSTSPGLVVVDMPLLTGPASDH